METKLQVLTEHYQKTYELTNQHWAQRNRLFLYLIAVVTGAAVLTYRPADANPLLVAWVGKLFGVTAEEGLKDLGQSFPFALVHMLLLLVVFYLMVNLCHRALYVLRSYQYLAVLESEIRSAAGFNAETFAFARESDFYWKDRPWLLKTVKWAYVVLLFFLLAIFLGGRLSADLACKDRTLLVVDLLVGAPIAMYFLGYAWYTLRRDSADTGKEKDPGIGGDDRGKKKT